jgi:uncharacterized membrane protein YphA (DoxX/SURF4 family)
MTNPTAERITLNATAQNLLRIVIASYFLAVALNLIPGTSLTVLAEQVLPAEVAGPLSAMVVFALAFLVMVGLFMRPAALVLGLMTLFASYLQMIELGVADELGTFWRDLVLIAALMLTYAENAPRDYRMRSAIRRKVTPRRISPSDHPHRARPAARPVAIAAAEAPAKQEPSPEVIPLPTPAFVSRRSAPSKRPALALPGPVENIFIDAVAAP